VARDQIVALKRSTSGPGLSAAALAGELREAQGHLDALDTGEEGDRYFEAETLTHLGDTHQTAGRPREAASAWRQALAILDDLRHANAEQVRSKLRGVHPSPR
jgi:hypothetical protein